jgi:hypothetical protein
MTVVQAFSSVIRVIDRDFNMHLLASGDSRTLALWYKLYGHASIVDLASVAGSVKFTATPLPSSEAAIENSSRHAVMFAKFPFSARVIRLMEDASARSAICTGVTDIAIMQTRAEKAFISLLGPDTVACIQEFSCGRHNAYLHDLVHIVTHRFPGVSFDHIHQVYELVLSRTRSDSLSTIGNIHASVWFNEARLLRLCSLLSYLSAEPDLVNDILTAIAVIPKASSSTDDSAHATSSRLAALDVSVLHVILKRVWARLNLATVSLSERQSARLVRLSKPAAPAPRANKQVVAAPLEETDTVSGWSLDWSAWLDFLAGMVADVEESLLELAPFEGKSITGALTSVDSLWQQWLAFRVVKVFLQEFVLKISSVDTMLPAAEIGSFVEAVKTIQIDSAGSFVDVVNSVMAIESLSTPSICYFVAEYIQDVVFGEQKKFAMPSHRPPLSAELIQQVFVLLDRNAASFKPPKLSKGSKPTITSLVLTPEAVSSILYALIQAGSTVFNGVFARISNLDVQRVYMTLMTSIQPLSVITNADVDMMLRKPDEARMSADRQLYLERVVAVQAALREYGNALLACLESDSPRNQAAVAAAYTMPIASLLTRYEPARLYVVKHMRTVAGADVLETIVRSSPKLMPWLQLDRTVLTSKVQSVMNPLPWAEVDRALFDKLSNALMVYVAGSKELKEFREICTSTKTKVSCGTVLAVLASQVALAYDSIYVGRLAPLKEFLKGLFTETNRSWADMWPVAEWILAGCKSNSSQNTTLSRSEILRVQLVLHLMSAMANAGASSIFRELLVTPERCMSLLLPAMPDDEFAAIVAISGHVGWYKCPNGHPYSVGNCTRPMEESICTFPGCKAKIGGRDHVSAKGNVRLEGDELRGNLQRGYDKNATLNEYNLFGPGRANPNATMAIRILLHATMLSAFDSNFSPSGVAKLVLPSGDVTSAHKAICERYEADMRNFSKAIDLSQEDSLIILHLVIRNMKEQISQQPSHEWANASARVAFEANFQRQLDAVLGSNPRQHILSARSQLEDSGRLTRLKAAYSNSTWDAIHERVSSPNTCDLLWQCQTPITFDLFERYFNLSGRNTDQYRLLASFLKVERRLPLIKHIGDILAWHAVVFEALQGTAFKRIDAANLTNLQLIQRLPEGRRADALKVLDKFCVAFNNTLPLVELIFECEENMFLKNKQVDLTGVGQGEGKAVMTRDVAVSFSIPSLVQGIVDQSLCTIRILEELQASFTELLASLNKSVDSQPPDATDATVAQAATTAQEPMQRVAQHEPTTQARNRSVAPLSYLTSPSIVQRQLIVYEREANAMCLLRTCVSQSLDYGQGGIIAFNFDRIQAGLANSLLAGKREIAVSVRHFQFTGEIEAKGSLHKLQDIMPQSEVFSSVLDAVYAEIDTQDRLVALMSQLEDCVNFIASIGHAAKEIDGTTKLEKYVLDIMLVSPDHWSCISTHSITQNIELRHLVSLFTALNRKLTGDVFEIVALRYRDPLSDTLAQLCASVATRMNVPMVLDALDTLLRTQLTEPHSPADASLKEYLIYTNDDLSECDWYDTHFPEQLELRHALSAYLFLSKPLSK